MGRPHVGLANVGKLNLEWEENTSELFGSLVFPTSPLFRSSTSTTLTHPRSSDVCMAFRHDQTVGGCGPSHRFSPAPKPFSDGWSLGKGKDLRIRTSPDGSDGSEELLIGAGFHRAVDR